MLANSFLQLAMKSFGKFIRIATTEDLNSFFCRIKYDIAVGTLCDMFFQLLPKAGFNLVVQEIGKFIQ
ncbi:MAG: hypothetical protein A3F68_02090 [Acidobacteria bacterium RIFCSPLOWO2_12_FULL_54_10]|nr:MAG: hypothetical protein A3F68_02090 [Acidobacteria bacterium RIFCSPLOWO2_12_FULL_54_10]